LATPHDSAEKATEFSADFVWTRHAFLFIAGKPHEKTCAERNLYTMEGIYIGFR